MAKIDDRAAEIYEQDCEFTRYQDNLRWSRFQTAALVEGAIVYAVWGVEKLDPWIGFIASILGFLLIFVIVWLAQIDERDYGRHIGRIRKFEDAHKLDPKEIAFVPRWLQPLKGASLMAVSSLILLSFNAMLIVVTAQRLAQSGHNCWLCWLICILLGFVLVLFVAWNRDKKKYSAPEGSNAQSAKQ